MKFQIKHRWTSSALFELEIGSLKLAVEAAVKSRADLRVADLSGADLSGADLGGADLGGADLSGAYIEKGKTKINWESHDLVAEILRRAAGEDVEKLKIAGLLLVTRNWCWKRFAVIDDPLKEWAFCELRAWVTNNDDAPDILKVPK